MPTTKTYIFVDWCQNIDGDVAEMQQSGKNLHCHNWVGLSSDEYGWPKLTTHSRRKKETKRHLTLYSDLSSNLSNELHSSLGSVEFFNHFDSLALYIIISDRFGPVKGSLWPMCFILLALRARARPVIPCTGHVTLSQCHAVTLSRCHFVTLSLCHFVNNGVLSLTIIMTNTI